jgi:hypothetical protein
MLGLNRQTAAKPCIIIIPDPGEDLCPVLATKHDLGTSLRHLEIPGFRTVACSD